jgi:hypothetical protein
MIVAASSLASRPAHAERTLQDEILESKYRHGDYGIYGAWYDPSGEQFDEHGSYAVPVGLKIRFRWKPRVRLEGEFAYYRTSGEPRPVLTTASTPEFDGVQVALSVEGVVRNSGLLRPYVGAGVLFVSLANDFVVQRPEVIAVDPNLPEVQALARWSKLDFGLHAQAGVDVHLGYRAFPFVEYRQLMGKIHLDEVRIGPERRPPSSLLNEAGEVLSDEYDYSGPMVLLGLKIYF